MPALIPTDYRAEITWLGQVPEQGSDLSAKAVSQLDLEFGGPVGERHSGVTRPSCSRVLGLWPRGTTIANVRQLSVVSAEQLERIAAVMGIEEIDPAWLGATMVVRGIPDFTYLPPSSRLQAENGMTLVVDMENRPCVLPGRVIETHFPGKGAAFKPAAKGMRGVTAWVEHTGSVKIGDQLRLFVPSQPAWSPDRG